MTTLIRGGRVCDGIGSPSFVADILISGKYITHIAPNLFGRVHADTVIDAGGALVTPGFIDGGAASDRYGTLFSDPHQSFFIEQGVTTILVGTCGVSAAPLFGGSVDILDEWGSAHGSCHNWKTLHEYLVSLQSHGIGVNVGSYVGHATIRRGFTRGVARDLTDREELMFANVVQQSFTEGAFGASVGFSLFPHARVYRRDVVSMIASAAQVGRPVTFHAPHGAGHVRGVLTDAFDLFRGADVSLHVHHIQPEIGAADAYQSLLNLFREHAEHGNATFDVSPIPTERIPLAALLPPWAQRETLEAMCAEFLETRESSEHRLLSYFEEQYAGEAITLERIADRSLHRYEGKELGSLALTDSFSGPLPRRRACALLAIMRCTRLRATAFRSHVDETLLASYLSHPQALISAHSGGLREPTGTCAPFTRYLTLLRDNGVPLEQAVARVTSVPATRFSIQKRGRIAPRYYADIAVLSPETFQPQHMFVNGVCVFPETTERVLPGAALRAGTA